MMNKTILVAGHTRSVVDEASLQLSGVVSRVISTLDQNQINPLSNEFHPELIIYEVCEQTYLDNAMYESIKNEILTSGLPIIFLIPDTSLIEAISFIDHEAEDFIQKPVDVTLLKARVRAFFKKSAKMKQVYEQRMEKLRDNISFALPHEFRTSLNGILGFSDMIIKMFDGKQSLDSNEINDIKDMVLVIRDSGKHLNRLTENFLLYSQLQTLYGKLEKLDELRKNSLHNPNEVISETASTLIEEAKRKHDLKLNVRNAGIKVSPFYFYKLMYELVDNAIKFSMPGTPIEIKAGCLNGFYNICITDSGIGMTPEQVNSIGAYGQFDRFINEQQGAGLGLIIAKLIVSLHGGSFSIKSHAGIGTTVSISLPVSEINHVFHSKDNQSLENAIAL